MAKKNSNEETENEEEFDIREKPEKPEEPEEDEEELENIIRDSEITIPRPRFDTDPSISRENQSEQLEFQLANIPRRISRDSEEEEELYAGGTYYDFSNNYEEGGTNVYTESTPTMSPESPNPAFGQQEFSPRAMGMMTPESQTMSEEPQEKKYESSLEGRSHRERDRRRRF
ncbi:hypothetical protein GF386_05065 [Candidatus Pacearchaeota archaeon]|nr:hypothetical protein [Candidatus Pacearchaeota archaeon]MBD3283481.1 hypothetical protein [Candidatus Pacearchaeota archaeon]